MKKHFSALLVLLCAMSSSVVAWDSDYNGYNGYSGGYSDCCSPCDCDNSRMYIGAFGGGIYSNSAHIDQMGTAFFTEAEGGPLAVFAQGSTKKRSAGFGGFQIGYEWSRPNNCGCCSGWSFAAAGEFEAYFFSIKRKGHLINPTDRLPEHDFFDSFNVDSSVLLVNAVFSLNSSCMCGITPYVGGGIGATRVSLHKAKSLQVAPIELGINHFNSRRHDSTWAFAAQVKAGLRYNICSSFHIFAEYRYLFVDNSNYILGSTVDPAHVPTSPWNLKIRDHHYNAFAIGIQYDL